MTVPSVFLKLTTRNTTMDMTMSSIRPNRVELVNTRKMHFSQMGVSTRDIENLAQQIDDDFLLQLRTSFELGRFVLLSIKRPSKGPFS
jgi:hypothetical protein